MADNTPTLTLVAEVRAWLSTVAAALDYVMEQREARQRAMIRRAVAAKAGQRHAELQWESQVRASDQAFMTTMELLTTWTGCSDMPSMMSLLIDVRIRADKAEEAYSAWNETRLELEVAEALQDATPPDEIWVSNTIDKLRQLHLRYMLMCNLALNLIPEGTNA